jgi:hypothetical protein
MHLMKKLYTSLLFTALLLTIGTAYTSTFLKVNLDQVLEGSEFVFEGRVLSKETRLSPVNGSPYTYFNFEIIDVIKGSTGHNTIELGFMGGPKGDFILQVSDMIMPNIGEKGIYFVESLSQQLVHPFFGWQQGHHLIVLDTISGVEKVVPLMPEPNVLVAPTSVDEFKRNLQNTLKGLQ